MSRSSKWWAALRIGCMLVLVVAHEMANAQPVASKVSAGDCNAFRHYVLQEAREFGDKMSGTFLTAVSRFTKAGCVPRDTDGEIQLITETRQDAVSFGTVLDRMGKVDVLGASGVRHCHRPPNGKCAAAQRAGGR